MPINIILPASDKGRNLALYPSLPCVRGDSPQCGEMSRSDRGDRRRQRVAERSEVGGVVNYAGRNLAHQLNCILFLLCRSCRDGHALSCVAKRKGGKIRL